MELIFIIAIIWLLAASFTDLRKREVSDWLSFSLLAIAIGYSAAQSVIQASMIPLAKSLLGAAIFFILANALYYGKIFAGGDAKLLIPLGAIIPSLAFVSNILAVGGAYGLLYSLGLFAFNWKKVIASLKKASLKAHAILAVSLIALLLISIYFNLGLIALMLGAALALQLIQIFVSATEKVALIKLVSPKDLTEGDWLFNDVRIGKKILRADFRGLNRRDIALLRKRRKKVHIKYGIPFVPVFLIAFILAILYGNILTILVEKLALMI